MISVICDLISLFEMGKASKKRTREDDAKLPAGLDKEDEDDPAPMEAVFPDGDCYMKCVEVLHQMLNIQLHIF